MGNGADDEAEAFEGAAGFAGQTEHERFVHDDGEVAREDGVLGDLAKARPAPGANRSARLFLDSLGPNYRGVAEQFTVFWFTVPPTPFLFVGGGQRFQEGEGGRQRLSRGLRVAAGSHGRARCVWLVGLSE